MWYQILVLSGLSVFLVNIILNIVFIKRPSKKAALPDDLPLVSVMVPARNEEDNIGACLCSLLAQDYPNIEVLVLDDNSTDGTAKVVNKIREHDARLHLHYGRPLPAGWAGKCFACHQLAQYAKGEWLLFVDADTRARPHMVRSTLNIAIAEHLSMLTGLPKQEVSGLTQKIVIPVLFYFLVISWFPLWLLHSSKRNLPTLAIGQFLMFRRSDYLRIGGHMVVKSRIMEDVWFGIEMSRRGGKTLAVDLSGVTSTGMYGNLASMTEGCLKWFYSIASLSPLALVGFVLAGYIFYLAPFYWVYALPASMLLEGRPLDVMAFLVVIQVALIIVMRIIVDWYFKGWRLSFVFNPLGIAFLILSVVYGASRRFVGAGVAWKDRVYQELTNIK